MYLKPLHIADKFLSISANPSRHSDPEDDLGVAPSKIKIGGNLLSVGHGQAGSCDFEGNFGRIQKPTAALQR